MHKHRGSFQFYCCMTDKRFEIASQKSPRYHFLWQNYLRLDFQSLLNIIFFELPLSLDPCFHNLLDFSICPNLYLRLLWNLEKQINLPLLFFIGIVDPQLCVFGRLSCDPCEKYFDTRPPHSKWVFIHSPWHITLLFTHCITQTRILNNFSACNEHAIC